MGATFDKLKGKAKQAEGRLTNDRIREGQGKLEEAKAEVEGAASRAAARVKRGVRRMRDRVAAGASRARRRSSKQM
jgi:uncharacterized protein YjbJ (UPF0337 family)